MRRWIRYLKWRWFAKAHRRTDPACHYHRPPRGWWSKRRYDRARGIQCDLCMLVRARARQPFWSSWRVWRDEVVEPTD